MYTLFMNVRSAIPCFVVLEFEQLDRYEMRGDPDGSYSSQSGNTNHSEEKWALMQLLSLWWLMLLSGLAEMWLQQQKHDKVLLWPENL